jgi:hypothetical protein
MTRGIPKKRQRAEQLRKKRLQAAPARAAAIGLAQGAKKPMPTAANRPSVGRAEPLPAHSYPAKRVALGKRQAPA